MKTTFTRIIISLTGLISITNHSYAQFAGGTGTETDPWQITTLAQLDAMKDNPSAHYKLMNNLIFTATDDLNGDEEGNFTSIYSFSGLLDGNGKTIKGLANKEGLFKYIAYRGMVKGLGIIDCNITGNSYAGGIAATNAGEINTCFCTGTISGKEYIGGIAGSCSGGSITASYNAATIDAPEGISIGGITGSISGAYINTCYNTGDVTGDLSVGEIVGTVGSGKIVNCYFLSETINRGIGTKPEKYMDETIALSAADMKTSGFTDKLNNPFFVPFWKTNTGNFPVLAWQTGVVPTPEGTMNDPYIISSLQELNKVRNYIMMFSSFKLANDLNFATTDLNGTNAGNFDPIGSDYKFRGNFDGNNKTITGLVVDQENTGAYAGLFGYTALGTIKNLSLKDCSVKGIRNTGGIVGYCDGGKALLNCSFSGEVTGIEDVGGLIGRADYIDSIKYCSNVGTVTGMQYVGGITGGVYNGASATAQIEFCLNNGNIKEREGSASKNNFGGLFGGVQAVSIAFCHNSGNITAPSSDKVAGLVSYANSGKLIACYNEGNVTGKNCVSGIGIKSSACYNTGNITGERYVGGIIGTKPGDLGVISWTKWGTVDGASGTYSTPYIVSCYNTGLIKGKQDVDGICSHKYSSSGSFYIDGKVISDEKNNMFEVEEGAQPVTEIQMKSIVVLNALNLAMKSSTDYWFYTAGDFPKLTASQGSEMTTRTVSIAIAPFGVPVEIDGIRFNTIAGTYHQIKLPEGTYQYKIADYPASTVQTITISSGFNNINLNTGITSVQGAANKIYQLATPEHIHLVRYANSSDFVLENDILFESNHDFSRTDGNFYPIRYYDGLFNGDNHTISGLNIQKDSLTNVGLFAEVNAKEGRNLHSGIFKLGIINCNIKGKTNVGSIAGYADYNVPHYGFEVDSCYASGTITGYENIGGLFGTGNAPTKHSYNLCKVTGYRFVGGIAGSKTSGEISECHNEGLITGYGKYIGGIAGRLGMRAKDCHNLGDITAPSDSANYIGGIAGVLSSGWDPLNMYGNSEGHVINCYNNGNISTTTNMLQAGIGGIAGTSGGYLVSNSVKNSYNSGKITVSGNELNIGGIIGYASYCLVETSYNKGEIIASGRDNRIGGIVGHINFGKLLSTYNSTGLTSLQTSGNKVGGVAGYSYLIDFYGGSPFKSAEIARSFYWQEEDVSVEIPGIGNAGSPDRLNNPGIVVDTTKAMTAIDMRKSNFVDSLNYVLKDPAWKMDLSPNINNGFPILLWQTEGQGGNNILENKIVPEWKIYPNPVTDRIYFTNLPEKAAIKIIDIDGKLIANNYTNVTEMDLSHLPAGLYLLQMTLPDGKVINQKIVKK